MAPDAEEHIPPKSCSPRAQQDTVPAYRAAQQHPGAAVRAALMLLFRVITCQRKQQKVLFVPHPPISACSKGQHSSLAAVTLLFAVKLPRGHR